MGFKMLALAGQPDALLATGAMRFYLNNNSTDEVMRISSTGNFIIGRTNSDTEVVRSRILGRCWTDYPQTWQLMFRRNTSASTFLTFTPGSSSGNAGIRVQSRLSRDGNISYYYMRNSPLAAIWDNTQSFGPTPFGWSIDQAGLAIMRLNSSLNGIGIRFTFNDGAFTTQTGSDIGASARFGLGAFTSGPRQRVMTGGTTAGTVTGAITVNNTSAEFVNLSDYRRKTNIEPMVDAVGTVKRLRPVWYNLRGFETDPPYAGFIAHEFQEVIRDGVTGYHDQVDEDGEPVYQLMDKRTAIPALVGAVQELHQRVAAARERLDTLKGNN